GWFFFRGGTMDYQQLKEVVLATAVEMAKRGPGWAQESVVLREAAARLQTQLGRGLPAQQAILTAWHELFLEKRLSWGYDLDNPSSAFFHIPEGNSTGERRLPTATASAG